MSARLLLIIFLLIGPSAFAEDERKFDIAGVEIGMMPVPAFEALEERGYRLDDQDAFWTRHGPSFDQLVLMRKRELDRREAVDVWVSAKFVKEDEEVVVSFIALPDGAFASRVIYRNSVPTLSYETMRERAISKYGEPHTPNLGFSQERWSSLPLIGGTQIDRGGDILELSSKSFQSVQTLDLLGPSRVPEQKQALEQALEADSKKANSTF